MPALVSLAGNEHVLEEVRVFDKEHSLPGFFPHARLIREEIEKTGTHSVDVPF